METTEKSQGFNELATTNPQPKDDGSSNPNPPNPLNPLQSGSDRRVSGRIYRSERRPLREYCNNATVLSATPWPIVSRVTTPSSHWRASIIATKRIAVTYCETSLGDKFTCIYCHRADVTLNWSIYGMHGTKRGKINTAAATNKVTQVQKIMCRNGDNSPTFLTIWQK